MMTLLTFLLMYAFFYLPIPTLLLFKDGQPVDMSVGVKSKAELENFLK